jgi:hypothetical protein
MKKMFFAVLLTLGSVAFAKANLSWEEIYQRGWYGQFPQIQFENVYVGVNSVCVAGDYLKATISVCTEWSGGESNNCTRFEDKAVSQHRVQTRTECVQWSGGDNDQCLRYDTVTRTTPTTYMVPVVMSSGDSEQHLFNKSFTIPACN